MESIRTGAMNRTLRDKIIAAGAGVLSDEELLCAVMQSDASDDSMKVAADLLTGSGLREIAETPAARLRKSSGCGVVRAARIEAAAELARRIRAAESSQVQTVGSDKDVVKIFAPLTALPHEEFWVLFLTTSGRIIDKVKVSQGGVSGTVVDYKLIVKQAVMLLADSMILVHNHPSGTAEPSRQDKEVTERIAAAAALFDIRLLDHIIVSSGGYFSMHGKGLL